MITAPYAILTPYLLPLGSPKAVNIGDGFIMDSCEKLIGASASVYFSSRAPLDDAAIERINNLRCLVVAGANSLRDDFTIAPGFTREMLAHLRVPVVLIGLGHYGIESVTQGLQPASVQLLEAVLERFPLMSVRCDRSHAYVVNSAPQLREKVLMTSCPVAYSVDGVEKKFERKESYAQAVVTITDREHLEAQLSWLPAVRACVAAEHYVVALHQDYRNENLHRHAEAQGYEVFVSNDYKDFLELYRASDFHIGNRLHGHLKALSMQIVSFLLPFDLRQAFFAESLDFPLISSIPSPEFQAYDFNRFLARRQAAAPLMQKIIDGVKALIA